MNFSSFIVYRTIIPFKISPSKVVAEDSILDFCEGSDCVSERCSIVQQFRKYCIIHGQISVMEFILINLRPRTAVSDISSKEQLFNI